MAYDFKVLAVGTSSWSFLEGVAAHLEQILGEAQVQELQNQSYELWQVNTLNDKQGNNGFILLFRRPR